MRVFFFLKVTLRKRFRLGLGLGLGLASTGVLRTSEKPPLFPAPQPTMNCWILIPDGMLFSCPALLVLLLLFQAPGSSAEVLEVIEFDLSSGPRVEFDGALLVVPPIFC